MGPLRETLDMGLPSTFTVEKQLNPRSSLWIPSGSVTPLWKRWWRYVGSYWSTDRLRHSLLRKRISTVHMTFLRLSKDLVKGNLEFCRYTRFLTTLLQDIPPLLKSGVPPFLLSSPPRYVLVPHFRLQPLCQSPSGSSLQEDYFHELLLLLQNRPSWPSALLCG